MSSHPPTNRMPEPQANRSSIAATSNSHKSASSVPSRKRSSFSSAAAASPDHKKTKREESSSERMEEDDDSANGSEDEDDEDSEDDVSIDAESKDTPPSKSLQLRPAAKSESSIPSQKAASSFASPAASSQEAAASTVPSDVNPSSAANLVTSPSDIPSTNPIQLRLIEDFLAAEECRELIAASEDHGFGRSTVGDANITADRTSFTSSAPAADPHRAMLLQRIRARVLEQPFGEAELAVVRYEPGQQYQLHRDSHLHRGERMRQYTIFVYLNDVGSGGETWFPRLGLKVKPKRGAALVWENHASRYTEVHDEAEHAGLPPTEGVKYGLNLWLSFPVI